jgi:hypothetical protein
MMANEIAFAKQGHGCSQASAGSVGFCSSAVR